MRNIESHYLLKMQNTRLQNQQLIMTLQSFNRLNVFAIRKNQLQCISNRAFTQTILEAYQKELQQDKLDNVGFALYFNELAKIERESILAFGSGNDKERTLFEEMLKLNMAKLLTRVERFSNHHLLIILSGFGNIFTHRESLRYINKEFIDVMLHIAKHFDKKLRAPQTEITSPHGSRLFKFSQLHTIFWSFRYMFLDHPEDFGFFLDSIEAYLNDMIDTKSGDTSAFDICLDQQSAMKLAKTLSQIDPPRTRFGVFWREFESMTGRMLSRLESPSSKPMTFEDLSLIVYVMSTDPLLKADANRV